MVVVTKQFGVGKPKSDDSTYHRCPWCNGRDKLEYHHSRRIYYCHKCKRTGVVHGGGYVHQVGSKLDELPDFYPVTDGPMWDYLTITRKIPQHLVAILYPHRGQHRGMVYIPIFAFGRTNPVSWFGRAISKNAVNKAWHCPNDKAVVAKTATMWGLHRLTAGCEEVVLTEGVFDAVWFPTGLALFGKTVSDDQISILNRIAPQRVTLCLDRDATSEQQENVLRLVHGYSGEVWVRELLRHADPDDACKSGEHNLWEDYRCG